MLAVGIFVFSKSYRLCVCEKAFAWIPNRRIVRAFQWHKAGDQATEEGQSTTNEAEVIECPE
jgi:hypothetical protein